MTVEAKGWLNRIPDWAIFISFCLLFTLELVHPLQQQSATFDEPANLVSGYLSLRFGNDRLIPQNLPLVKLVAAVPLLHGPDYAMPPAPKPWSAEAQYRYASRFLYQLNGGDDLLLRGRLALLLPAFLLGWGVFLWAKQLFGRTTAVFALLVYAVEPNVLGHSALITTDIATACFMFWTLFGWHHLLQSVTWTRVVLSGLSLGLALISKFTALTLIPILLLTGMLAAIGCAHPLQIRLRGLTFQTVVSVPRKLLVLCMLIAGLGAVGLTVIWAGYRFSYQSAVTPIPTYPTPWEHSVPASLIQQRLITLARDARLVPEAYIYGLAHQLKIGGTHEAYLMGDIRSGGWWYYFLVTLGVKTPVPLLLALILAIPLGWMYWRNNSLAFVCLLGPIALYFIQISSSGWNIGHRHLLPILPLLILIVSSLCWWAIGRRIQTRLCLAGLLSWYVLSSIFVHPHYLAYFNEIAGGPNNGHQYLVDSNLDWGQDLKGLKRYMDEQGIDRIWLSYFGQASPEYYGIQYDYLPSFDIFDPKNVDPSVFRIAALPPLPGTVAISATLLQGGALQTVYGLGSGYFEYYRKLTPVAKIGYSIFVYRPD